MAVKTLQHRAPPAKKVHPLLGYGAQLNADLFSLAGEPEPLTAAQRRELGRLVAALEPGHCRIFVPRGLRPDTEQGRRAPKFVALMKALELAGEAGATVNLTWWGQGPYGNERKLRLLRWPNPRVRDWPHPHLQKWPAELTDPAHPNAIAAPRLMMLRFAQIVAEARRRKLTCVTHLTVQNEVNGESTDIAKHGDPGLSMRLYELLYRHLDDALRGLPDPLDPQRSLRETVALVGGDLLERTQAPRDSQEAWLRYLHANMERPREGFPSVLDGYSIHLYWEPTAGSGGFPAKLETRLRELEQTIRSLPSPLPIYVTEYGVRFLKTKPRPGSLHGTKMEQSPEAAFQHAWFNALAPQYGCAGLVKWALYRTDTGKGWGEWGMIGAPRTRFQLSPLYHLTRLYNLLLPPGWLPSGLSHMPGQQVVSSRFTAPDNRNESVALVNAGPTEPVRVTGLRPRRRYVAVDWNRDGRGTLQPHEPPTLTADATGAATLTVPHHGVVGLSTRELPL